VSSPPLLVAVAATTISDPRSRTWPSFFSQDQLGQVRKAALGVLATLRELEERARLLLRNDAYDARSDRGLTLECDSRTGTVLPSPGSGLRTVLSPECPARSATTFLDVEVQGQSKGGGDADFAFTLVTVAGRDEHVPSWEEEG
jgi:hypothetical protein